MTRCYRCGGKYALAPADGVRPVCPRCDKKEHRHAWAVVYKGKGGAFNRNVAHMVGGGNG